MRRARVTLSDILELCTALAVALMAAALLSAVQLEAESAPAPAAVCEEDMPCWNCTTHGNRICGEAPRLEARGEAGE